MIHQSTLITDRFIHSCPKHTVLLTSLYYALYYVYYWPAHRWETGRENLYSPNWEGGEGALETKSADFSEIFQPWCRGGNCVVLERNCWFCWNLWTFEIARDRIEEPESACVGIWGEVIFPQKCWIHRCIHRPPSRVLQRLDLKMEGQNQIEEKLWPNNPWWEKESADEASRGYRHLF